MPVGMLRKVSGKCSYLGKCVEQPYLIHSVTQVRGAPSVGQNCPSVASLLASTIASKGHLGENGASGLVSRDIPLTLGLYRNTFTSCFGKLTAF